MLHGKYASCPATPVTLVTASASEKKAKLISKPLIVDSVITISANRVSVCVYVWVCDVENLNDHVMMNKKKLVVSLAMKSSEKTGRLRKDGNDGRHG